MSASIRIRLGSIGGGTDFRISSALSGVSFQLGSSSVSSGPSPRSMSSRLYSQLVAGVTVDVTVTKLGAVVIVVSVVVVLFAAGGVVIGLATIVATGADAEPMEADADETGNRSLPLSGSRADCEDRLSTEPQLIGRRSQSSSPP